MSFRSYRRPFWVGLLHATSILLYTVFISLIWLAVLPLVGEHIAPVMNLAMLLFVAILSVAVVGYFIFFEPFKLIVHHHFKRATMLLMSTFGWLFVYAIIFVVALITTMYS